MSRLPSPYELGLFGNALTGGLFPSTNRFGGRHLGVGSPHGTNITFSHNGSETTSGRFVYIVSDGANTDQGIVHVHMFAGESEPAQTRGTGTLALVATISLLAMAMSSHADSTRQIRPHVSVILGVAHFPIPPPKAGLFAACP